jgi:hypothetical protein
MSCLKLLLGIKISGRYRNINKYALKTQFIKNIVNEKTL